jgi:glycosyltransferase involved in cell wall biosynthesis
MRDENNKRHASRKRPLIAFFDYPDVFEDFYSHYGVDHKAFATSWINTANHEFINLIQAKIGDVVWYEFSLNPEIEESVHENIGCRIKFVRSSFIHRMLWRAFYLSRMAWRWQRFYRFYATIASYLVMLNASFLKTICKDRPDIIFVQDYASGRFDILLLIAKLMNVPLIAVHTGSPIENHLAKSVRRLTIRHADFLIPSSYNELKLLISRYNVSEKKLRVVLTPIDMETYQPIARKVACEKVALNPERRYFLFVGRLDDGVKRVSAIIQAFSDLAADYKDADLLIVGDGNDAKKLRQLALDRALSERVHFLGWVTEAEKKVHFYNVAECLLLASTREGFPTVVGEALSCGTPVISTRVGGVSELVVDGENGWLFPPEDLSMLSIKLKYVLDNPTETAQMRVKARKTAENRVAPQVISEALSDIFFSQVKK